jgi:hypothetical protein
LTTFSIHGIIYIVKEAMNRMIFTFALVGIFSLGILSSAAMTSTNYEIRWDSLNAGGSDTASSASYGLRDSISQLTSGGGTSTSYEMSEGFRAGIYDQVIALSLFFQNRGAELKVSSLSSTTISMTSTSGISVGDYIMLVQDVSSGHVSAVGKVTAVVANTSVTVDELTDGGSAPVIDGSGDYMYEMNASSLTFDTLTPAVTRHIAIGMEVTADIENGYTVQMMDSGDIAKSGVSIPDVTDGSVTAGTSEYGARSSDTTITATTFDTEDTAITSAFQDVVTESSAKFEDKNFITLKVATETYTAGTYTHTISIVASGNF